MTNLHPFVKEWVFVNYCGQKKGQFKNANLKSALLNVLVIQVALPFNIILAYSYILLGLRNFFVFTVLLVVLDYFIRKMLKKHFMVKISFPQLNKMYKNIPNNKRVLNFAISIVLVALSVILFGYSLGFLKYFLS